MSKSSANPQRNYLSKIFAGSLTSPKPSQSSSIPGSSSLLDSIFFLDYCLLMSFSFITSAYLYFSVSIFSYILTSSIFIFINVDLIKSSYLSSFLASIIFYLKSSNFYFSPSSIFLVASYALLFFLSCSIWSIALLRLSMFSFISSADFQWEFLSCSKAAILSRSSWFFLWSSASFYFAFRSFYCWPMLFYSSL